MIFTVESDIGLKRAVNEDRAAVIERPDNFKLAVLADGMGGHNAGDVASEMAINILRERFTAAEVTQLETQANREQWLEDAVSHTNYEIYQYSLQNEGCKGMGTTLIACVLDRTNCTIAHVGDSRLYYFTNEDAQLITRDHSYVNALIDKGAISEEEAENHPNKNVILRALGTEMTIKVDFYELNVVANSYVLICSDGLSNKLSISEMAAIITLPKPLKERGKMLVQLANDSGGEDNISLILFTPNKEV